jgi:hypothetical protein
VLCLWSGGEGEDVVEDVQDHVFAESAGNVPQTFRGLFSNHRFFFSQAFNEHIDDFFQVVLINVAVV